MERFRNVAIFLFFSLSLFILIVGSLFNYHLSPVGEDHQAKEIVISNKDSIDDVATMLYEEKLIRNPKMFKLYLNLNGIKKLNEGTFSINQSMSSREIVKHILDWQ